MSRFQDFISWFRDGSMLDEGRSFPEGRLFPEDHSFSTDEVELVQHLERFSGPYMTASFIRTLIRFVLLSLLWGWIAPVGGGGKATALSLTWGLGTMGWFFLELSAAAKETREVHRLSLKLSGRGRE